MSVAFETTTAFAPAFVDFCDDRIQSNRQNLADTVRAILSSEQLVEAPLLNELDDRQISSPLILSELANHDRNPARIRAAVEAGRQIDAGRRPDGIMIHKGPVPAFAQRFVDEAGVLQTVETTNVTQANRSHLERALRLIETLHPRLYNQISASTSSIQIFRSRHLNSFATLAAHGAAFLNVTGDHDEIFFVEDIAHQAGHVIFNDVTFDRDLFFAVDPDTPLASVTHEPDETRSVYQAFHGVFTEALMYQALAGLRTLGSLTAEQAHELDGRIGFVVGRFGSDLARVANEALFTEAGLWVLGQIIAQFSDAHSADQRLVAGFDYSNQPYAFDAGAFAERNSLSPL